MAQFAFVERNRHWLEPLWVGLIIVTFALIVLRILKVM